MKTISRTVLNRNLLPALGLGSAVALGGLVAPAHAGEVIAIGQTNSPVLAKVAKNRERREAKSMIRSMRQRMTGQLKVLPGNQRKAARAKMREEIKALRQQLKAGDVDAVIADLATVNLTAEDESLVQAAAEEGIPVALENVTGEKMKALLGVGTDADLVVAESRNNGGEVQLTLWGDKSIKFERGEVEVEFAEPPPDLTAEQLEQRKQESVEKATRSIGGDPGLPPAADRSDKTARIVENILATRPFANGAVDLAEDPEKKFTCDGAEYRCREYTVKWGSTLQAIRWCPNNEDCRAKFQPEIVFGMYQGTDEATSASASYVLFRTQGTAGSPMTWDYASNRGYYMEGVSLAYTPYYKGIRGRIAPGWSLERTSPQTANVTGSISTSTGFSVGLGGGGNKTGPNVGLSIGYSSSTSSSVSLSAWEVSHDNAQWPIAAWLYRLSSTGGDAYNFWQDLADKDTFWSGDLDRLPLMSTKGFDTRSEAIWRGPGDFTGTVDFAVDLAQTVRRVFRECVLQSPISTVCDWYDFVSGAATMSILSNWQLDFGDDLLSFTTSDNVETGWIAPVVDPEFGVIGRGVDVGVGADGSVWVLGIESVESNYPVFKWDYNQWRKVSGGGVRIAVAPDGTPWLVNNVGEIFKANDTNASAWTKMPGGATDIGIGPNGTVWIIGTGGGHGGGHPIFKLKGAQWQQVVTGAAVRIAVGPNGIPWVINDAGDVFEANDVNASGWIARPRPMGGRDIGIGADGSVWTTGNTGPARWTGSTWEGRGQLDAGSIAVAPDGNPWVTHDADYRILQYEPGSDL